MACSLTGYKAAPGLTAAVTGDTLAVTWDGAKSQQLRLRFEIAGGTPTIRELAIRRTGGTWTPLASNVTPEFRIVSGMRRMSNQQMQPLRALGVEITPDVVDRERWEAFWDAPLDVPGITPGVRPGNNLPPDLPRNASEIKRATASYRATGCEVKTNGTRLEISFPGLELGVFAGRLQYTVYKGTNLIRQEAVAKTDERAGRLQVRRRAQGTLNRAGIAGGLARHRQYLAGLSVRRQQERARGAAEREQPAADDRARCCRNDCDLPAAAHVLLGARDRDQPRLRAGTARTATPRSRSASARRRRIRSTRSMRATSRSTARGPARGSAWRVYFYASAEPGAATLDSVLAFTHGDRFKPLPGYQVMNHHYHMDLGRRLLEAGSLDAEIPDLPALKSLGINIVSQVDSVGFATPPAGRGTAPEGGRGAARRIGTRRCTGGT